MKTQSNIRTLWMVQTAILAAIIFLMAFTPLGYLRVGIVEITFLTIPVVIGAILIGPASGAVLGGVFGATSFIQAFGMSPFGVALMAINPFYVFILTMIPRILMGWLSGLIFQALRKIDRTKLWSYVVAALSGAVLNTVFFVGTLILLFGQSEYLRNFGDNVLAIIATLVTLNALIEAVVCMIAGGAITKGLAIALKHNRAETTTS